MYVKAKPMCAVSACFNPESSRCGALSLVHAAAPVGSTHYLGSQYYKYSQSPLSPVSLASILVPTQGAMVPPSSLFLAKAGLMEFMEIDGGHGA
jgi:hypothetical protein